MLIKGRDSSLKPTFKKISIGYVSISGQICDQISGARPDIRSSNFGPIPNKFQYKAYMRKPVKGLEPSNPIFIVIMVLKLKVSQK